MSKFTLRIYRGTPGNQYWEEFDLEDKPGANVLSSLMEIQENPINNRGEKTTPVVWEQGCLEEVCGSCSMLVNSVPRQGCTAIIAKYLEQGSKTITLAPFTKFPLIRDLYVNRDSMFEALKVINAFIPVDGTWENEFGPKMSPEVQEALYKLSTCMTCGCCSESCPQVNEKSDFMGPAAVSQVRLFNANPTGALSKSERLRSMMGEGGVAGCGNAQNCQKVCPKGIPLTESLALIGRETSKQYLKDFFSVPDAKK